MSRADPSPYHAVIRDGYAEDELPPSTQRPGLWRSWGDMVVGLLYYAVVLAFVVGAAWLVAVAS